MNRSDFYPIVQSYVDRTYRKLFIDEFPPALRIWCYGRFHSIVLLLLPTIPLMYHRNFAGTAFLYFIVIQISVHTIRQIHRYNYRFAMDRYPKIAKRYEKWSYQLFLEVKESLLRDDLEAHPRYSKKQLLSLRHLVNPTKHFTDFSKIRWQLWLLIVPIAIALATIDLEGLVLLIFALIVIGVLITISSGLIEIAVNKRYWVLSEMVSSLRYIEISQASGRTWISTIKCWLQ